LLRAAPVDTRNLIVPFASIASKLLARRLD
jgi:hypothetical protein